MRTLALTLCLAGCSSGAAATDAALTSPSDAVVQDVRGDDAAATDVRDGPVFRGDPAAPSKGPWVIRMEPTRLRVRWESRGSVTMPAIELRGADGAMLRTVTASNEETHVSTLYTGLPGVGDPDLDGSWYVHTADVTELAPGTCYRYAIVGFPETAARACTAHDDADRRAIRFMAIGDTDPVLGHTDGTLAAIGAMDPEFTVHLGDMQYYSAITETYVVWFRRMAPMLRWGAVLPSIGNHENELQKREFADYYARLFRDDGRDGELEWYHYATGGVHFFSLSTEANTATAPRQLAWLSGRLAEVEALPNYRFTVLYFHRPLYTVGDTSPRIDLRESLGQLAATHRVPLVLAGHMHGYERFEVGPVTYITSGGGGGIIGNVNENVARYPADAMLRRASGPWYHGMLFTITEHTLRGQAIDETGAVRDSFEKTVP